MTGSERANKSWWEADPFSVIKLASTLSQEPTTDSQSSGRNQAKRDSRWKIWTHPRDPTQETEPTAKTAIARIVSQIIEARMLSSKSRKKPPLSPPFHLQTSSATDHQQASTPKTPPSLNKFKKLSHRSSKPRNKSTPSKLSIGT